MSGSLSPEQAACFRDPAFLAAIPQMAPPVESAFVEAARLTGFVAAGFVLLGVVFSLLLPSMKPHPVEAARVPPEGGMSVEGAIPVEVEA